MLLMFSAVQEWRAFSRCEVTVIGRSVPS